MPKLPEIPEAPVKRATCALGGCDEPVGPAGGRLCVTHYLEALEKFKEKSEEAGKNLIIGEKKLTGRERVALDRARAEARCDAHFESMRQYYPDTVNAGRDTFVRREVEKVQQEVIDNRLDAVPDADRADEARRLKR